MVLNLDMMTFEEVEEYVSSGPGIVVLPLGSTEAHGPHAPTGVDTFAVRLVCREVATGLDAVVAPALPYGMATSLTRYGGTVALKPTSYAALVREICENFVRQGFSMVLAISGHRGNDTAALGGIQEAVLASEAHGLYLCYQDANKGHLGETLGEEYNLGATVDTDEKYGADGHGGSMELSLAMAYSPGCVRMDRRMAPDRGLADKVRGFPFRSILYMDEWAPTAGYFGDPCHCSEELGEKIARETAQRIVSEVKHYIELFPKRKVSRDE